MKYLVIIERGETSYGAYLPDLPGCVAVAQTEEEVRRLIAEAVPAHLQAMRQHGEPIPPPTTQAISFEVEEPALAAAVAA